MTDLIFLKALRDKLKGGNARSIHLNVLPGRYATRLDIANLNYIEPGLAEKFLEILLTKPNFEFKLSFDKIDLNSIATDEQKKLGLLSKRLNSLYIENEDNFKEHGIKTFGFGYPIIIKPSKLDPSKIIKAPLFIWPLEILKSFNQVNTWSLLRNKVRNENGKIVDEEIHSIGLNEVFISFVKTDENISIAKINEDLLEDTIINEDELLQTCIDVLKSLNADTGEELRKGLQHKFEAPLVPLPDAAWMESVTGNIPWIHFGGVFGLFRTQKESIITDIDKLIERYGDFEFENLVVEKFEGKPFSAIDTDPSQQEILNTLSLEPKKIIQGPPGTGKSQSLTALITNALENNLKCLVVCEKKTALEVIKNNLNRENGQLGELSAIIEDINKDRDGIINSVRERINTVNQFQYFNYTNYQSRQESISSTVEILNRQHRQLDKKIYQGKSWTEIVGNYLKKQKDTDIRSLKDKLDFNWFTFGNESNELSDTVNTLKQAKKLFADVNSLIHPLDILHDSVFGQSNFMGVQISLENTAKKIISEAPLISGHLKEQREECEKWEQDIYHMYPNPVKESLNDWIYYMKGNELTVSTQLPELLDLERDCLESIKELEELQAGLFNEAEKYNEWLHDHYRQYYNNVKIAVKQYLDFIDSNCAKFGSRFLKNGQLNKSLTSFLSLFSKKYKSLKEERVLVVSKVQEVKEVHWQYSYFGHTYLEISTASDLQIFVANIKQLSDSADTWYKGTADVIKTYFDNITSDTLHESYLEKRNRIAELEKQVKEISTNSNRRFEVRTPEVKGATLINSIDILFQLIKELKNLLNTVHSFRGQFKVRNERNEETIEKLNGFLKHSSDPVIFKEEFAFPVNFTVAEGLIDAKRNKSRIIIENILHSRDYYAWKSFFIEQNTVHQKVIVAMIEAGIDNWVDSFECWYLHWLLSVNEDKALPKSDDKIIEFIQAKEEVRNLQVKGIVSTWRTKQVNSLKRIQYAGLNPTSLFNKRGSRGERRNSLRKIINTDFELFTDFYPVLMVSPTVCSSILPLTEGIFDIVIFDEASQLRLEDTFPSLIRGKIKIVSGDSQQMPPSSYFQGGSAILNPTEEDADEEMDVETISTTNKMDNSLNLADSESLLVYAENGGYKQSYLKIHYRSQHPSLIDFSNNAFYGRRLIPMPAKKDYKPIHFVEVNGIYEEQVNRDEARQVVDILLNHIKPFRDGKYPSVGVATFNLYQRNLILEEITKARQTHPEYDKKISDYGSELFVKNLENIQGDERDIIIISTTFGRTIDGRFRQQFGPIIQRNGYKLLNVIITRAKYKVFVCTSIPIEFIKQYPVLLQQQKNNGRAAFYSYLAYAKAVHEGDQNQREAILKQLYDNCDNKTFDLDNEILGSESPFEEEVCYRLSEKLGQDRVQQQYKVGGFRIDIVIKSESNRQPYIAIECDGAKFHSSNEAYAWDMFRQKQLEKNGFVFYRIWSTNWWYSPEKELKKLIEFINAEDLKARQSESNASEAFYENIEIVPVTLDKSGIKRVDQSSIVTVKTSDNEILKVKFTKEDNSKTNQKNANDITVIYERSPLALALFGRKVGEVCQLGMLEVYYEITKIE